MISHVEIARRMRAQIGPRWSLNTAYQWGAVGTVHAGPPKTLDVYIDGSTVITLGLRYLASYSSPTVGDIVIIARMQTNRSQVSRVVLGELA